MLMKARKLPVVEKTELFVPLLFQSCYSHVTLPKSPTSTHDSMPSSSQSMATTGIHVLSLQSLGSSWWLPLIPYIPSPRLFCSYTLKSNKNLIISCHLDWLSLFQPSVLPLSGQQLPFDKAPAFSRASQTLVNTVTEVNPLHLKSQ